MQGQGLEIIHFMTLFLVRKEGSGFRGNKSNTFKAWVSLTPTTFNNRLSNKPQIERKN